MTTPAPRPQRRAAGRRVCFTAAGAAVRTEAPRAIALAGPTAAGKSAVALHLAQELPRCGGPQVEIVSVDSAQVYRGMDIGTAKPGAAERAAVPHHLLDILDPAQAYSAAQFAADAGRLIEAIRARGRLPLLVGGTMLYFKALREGLDPLPPADAAVRAALDARAAAAGWPALHAELARVDPATAQRLAPHDAQRIQRALEVWQLSGTPLSALQQRRAAAARAEHGAGGSGPGAAEAGGAAGAAVLIALEPADRGWLHRRIAERFDAMLAAGLVDEVRALRRRADLHAQLPSMRCVGYRQVWQALDEREHADPGALRERGIAATRQLAKRQITWLRALPDRLRVACDADDAATQVLRLTRSLVQGGG